ncbi:MAG TPA: hypothetical protein DDW65_04745 [Firmicutes bacterium]|jgi:raffinose/stachyose/melibiose transport system substrate-binding protein|nr:hypothetical protein [Bacillota bacterium]
MKISSRQRSLAFLLIGMFIFTMTLAVSGAEKTVVLRMNSGQPDLEYFTNINNLNRAYQKVKPNVRIELETFKNDGEFNQAMKIRKAANELPEIMIMKPYMLATFQDTFVPLNDLEATKQNKYAKAYAIDGKILGLPSASMNDFVYFRKSIFKEYHLKIPKTWDEFISTANRIKASGKYIPILMGAKDAWPDYSFNELMPCLIANDGKLWNTMAGQDEPFTKDKPFYQAYARIQKLYDAKVFGPDPLGMGFDQARAMLISKKGAMICAGQWFLSVYKQNGGDLKDLGVFLIPVRDRAQDVLNTIVVVDSFYCTPRDNKYLKESKDFINWFFSKKYYPGYMAFLGQTSTVNGIDTSVPLFKEALAGEKINGIVYDGGGLEFTKISSAVKFDVKRMGQEMIAGKDLDQMMNELNKSWKEARVNLK